MRLFGRKKEEEKTKDIEEIKKAVEKEEPEEVKIEELPVEEGEVEKLVEEEPKKEERPEFAPLFVKIDRYRDVLNLLTELKTTIVILKNALTILGEIEKLEKENRELMNSSIKKLEEKISLLDSEFIRPRGLKEELRVPDEERPGLEGVVDDLKTQIESIKSELERIS